MQGGLVAVLLIVLGWAAVRPVAVVPPTDRLGPEPNEPVADYLARSAESLDGTGPRWALVSLTTEIRPAEVAATTGAVRVSEVAYRVPIPRVQTRLLLVAVPGEPPGVADSAAVAADRLLTELPASGRQRDVATVSAARLRAGCACVVAVLVRGEPTQLRAIAARPGVRAVQALPADAEFGWFAVDPLLPEQLDRAGPGSDDGPVPPA
ncbi:hypothetical protein KV203_07145 [Skermania piniformis]|uniref:Uncharacterized protein n=1 Tax=Skermania pinensis TaxID=39122 RepID=A0ABX8SCV0_9ACTN|nr:hypothetical protein KV203_07145 [Skermania piniformis]